MAKRMEKPFHSPNRGATSITGDFVHSPVDWSVGAASNLVASVPSNHWFERSRVSSSVSQGGKSMIEINQLVGQQSNLASLNLIVRCR